MGFPQDSIDLLVSDEPGMTHQVMLSAVRFTLREYSCSMVPVVLGLAMRSSEPDMWGSHVYAELEYDGEACTRLGGTIQDDDRIKWTVYAD
jgi:hypothetical protein